MALDKKASELPDATNPRTASWAAYEDDGSGPADVRMTMDMVRPGVSAFGLRLALGANLQAVAGAFYFDHFITLFGLLRVRYKPDQIRKAAAVFLDVVQQAPEQGLQVARGNAVQGQL